jgi:hypothetical protein
MEKLRVEKKDIYTIEVNDKGETIEFDLADISLSFKCIKALEEIDKIKQNAKMREIAISKKEDVEGKYMSKKEEEILKVWQETFIEMRKAMDIFLGDGACKKIFGDRNYIEMYDDLMEQLLPHLDKMKISFDGMKNRIVQKYSEDKKNVIE